MSGRSAGADHSDGRRLILVGLGHVHLRLLERLTDLPKRTRVTIVAPHDGRCGNAVASLFSRQSNGGELRMAAPRDVEMLRSRMLGARPIHRRLWLADGSVVPYDALSLNTGTQRLPEFAAPTAANQPRVWSGHSITQLIALWQILDSACRPSVVIAGGTARALEIAGGLSTDERGSDRGRVTLLEPDIRPDRRVRAARRLLARRGVDIVLRAQVNALGAACVHTRDGRRFAADHLIWAGPPAPSRLAQALGLALAGPGLQVNRRLQSPRARTVFAAGALATIDGRRSLSGWDAGRQAAVIIANLHGLYGGGALRSYRPPRADSRPLNIGDGNVIGGASMGWPVWRRNI